MPRPRKGPRIYRRPGRPGLWAYLDRDHKDISLHTEDEAEALAKLSQLVRDHQLAEVPGDGPAAEPLGHLFDECERRARVESTPKTAYELGLNLRRIARWCLERGLGDAAEVTAQVVSDYRESRRLSVGERTKQKVSAARVNRELDAWKRAVKIAVERGTVPATSLQFFAHLREAKPAPHQRSLSKREIDAFLKAVPDDNLRALLRSTLGTGLRDEEVRHLSATWLSKGKLTISPQPPGTCTCHDDGWKTKGFRYREIPTTAATERALRHVVKARKAGWSIPSERWVWEQIQRACKAAKLAPFSLHQLRHAGASHWLADGVDIATISRWLGHRDVLTTQRYLHVVVDESANRRRLTW